jgi:heme-degrading monooxygenase HmoA
MDRNGQTAVIFLSRRTGEDEAGYAEAAAAMDALAAMQPGYRGMDSARGADGVGITVSWWADEASAVAWRRHAEHALIREQGRARWYAAYEVAVAEVGRSYTWTRSSPGGGGGPPAQPVVEG